MTLYTYSNTTLEMQSENILHQNNYFLSFFWLNNRFQELNFIVSTFVFKIRNVANLWEVWSDLWEAWLHRARKDIVVQAS